MIGQPLLDDAEGWQRRYREAVAEFEARCAGRGDAEIAAARLLLGEVISLMPPPAGDPSLCFHCGSQLPRGRLGYAVSQAAPVAVGQGCIRWAHRPRCQALAAEKIARKAWEILCTLLGGELHL